MCDDKFLIAHFPREQAERYGEWTECAAFRFVKVGEDQVVIEFARSLEEITAPEASR